MTNTFTFETLQAMKVADLRTLAVESGAGYYNAQAKRKMNKGELVAHLVTFFAAQATETVAVPEVTVIEEAVQAVEVTTVQVEQVTETVTHVESVVEVVEDHTPEQAQEATSPDFVSMTPAEVVKYVKQQAQQLDGKDLAQLVSQVLEANHAKLTDRRNKLLVRTWSNIKNQLNAMVKIASRKQLAQ